MEEREEQTWGDYLAECAEEEESAFDEKYGHDCMNCGQSIDNHDDAACAQ